MRPASLIASIALFSLGSFAPACSSAPSPEASDGSVNAVLGDTSFQAAYGRAPTAGDEEHTRITTHLRFVEAELRARDVSNLSEPLRVARMKNLQGLHDYWTAGVFPRNVAGTPRVPRFVEPAGAFVDEPRRVCAVGAIAEADLGPAAIDAISARHEHDLIAAIDDPALVAWAKASGLTTEELAMIQPSYDFMRPPIEDDGMLSGRFVQSVLATKTSAVNACVHGVLGPNDSHPKALVAAIAIAPEGRVSRVGVSGTTDARIRACVERAIGGATFRKSLAVSTHSRSFAIVGPRNDDGTLNDVYVPVVFERARNGVDRCGAFVPRTPAGAVRVIVKSRFDPEGGHRVMSIALDPIHGFELESDVRACIRNAVESKTSPSYTGSPRDFEFHYVTSTPK